MIRRDAARQFEHRSDIGRPALERPLKCAQHPRAIVGIPGRLRAWYRNEGRALLDVEPGQKLTQARRRVIDRLLFVVIASRRFRNPTGLDLKI